MLANTRLEGRFAIHDELFSRGARTVYFGTDEVTQKRCEIHVLDPAAISAERLAFTREAELMGRMEHSGALSTATVGGLPDGTLYYVASERAGSRIADRRGVPLPTVHVASIATQLLRVADHIHGLDWRLGWLAPNQIDERLDQGRLLVRIVRLPSAVPVGAQLREIGSDDETYVAPALIDGGPATIETDLFSVGRVLQQLASGTTKRPLPRATAAERRLAELIDGLCQTQGARSFATASDAADAFEQITLDWIGEFPIVPPVVRTVGQGRFRTADVATPDAQQSHVELRSSPELSPQSTEPPPQPEALIYEPAPSGLRRWWPAALLGALTVAAGVAWFARPQDPEPSAETTATVATNTAAGATTPSANGTPAPQAVASDLGNNSPTRAIAVLNRTELDRVLGFVERHELLDEIGRRPDLRARVDMRWNRLLDLVQAADAPLPCSTFRAALVELETPPKNDAERALLDAVVAPTPQTVLGAGAGSDGDCTGLAQQLDAARARLASRDPSATSPTPVANRRPTPRKPAKRRPATKTVPSKPHSVATRLDDDLKGIVD